MIKVAEALYGQARPWPSNPTKHESLAGPLSEVQNM